MSGGSSSLAGQDGKDDWTQPEVGDLDPELATRPEAEHPLLSLSSSSPLTTTLSPRSHLAAAESLDNSHVFKITSTPRQASKRRWQDVCKAAIKRLVRNVSHA